MEIEIIRPGILSTLQDGGRFGFRDSGMPTAGVMDSFAAEVANMLVGNEENATVLELTYADVEIISITDLVIACTGSGSQLFADCLPLSLWQAVFIPAGIRLKFKPDKAGCRTYVAITGGWKSKPLLGSGSTYLPMKIGGLNGSSLQKGDRLQNDILSHTAKLIRSKLNGNSIKTFNWGVYYHSLFDYSQRKIQLIRGHEFDWFDTDSQHRLLQGNFQISNRYDRMGYHLDSEPGSEPMKQHNQQELISTAVIMGTIQVTGEGKLILLMADCQTTGGYPRIAQVAAVSLPVCAQLKPGDHIQFKLISIEEAEQQLIGYIKELKLLKKWIALKLKELK